MTVKKSTVERLIIKGILAELPAERQAAINKCVADLHAAINSLPAGAERHIAAGIFSIDRAEIAASEGM